MKRNDIKNFFLAGILSAAMVTTLAGCGSSGNASAAANSDTTKIVIATTGTGPEPTIYQTADGELTGYDVDLVNAVFAKLPQYEIEYQTTEFSSIFSGLDAGYYQVGLNCMGYKKERGEKYLLSDIVNVQSHGILVREENTDINSVWDLGGHKTIVSPSSYNASTFEGYNAEHPDNPIDLEYTESDNNIALKVSDGTIDFYYFDVTTLELSIKNSGLTDLKIIPVPLEDSNEIGKTLAGEVVLFPKGYEQLAEDFNKAFEELLEEGKVLELQNKYYGITEETSFLDKEYIEYAKEYIANDIKNSGDGQ